MLPAYNYFVDWYGYFQSPENGMIKTFRKNINSNTDLNSPVIRTKNIIQKLQDDGNATLLMGSSRVDRGIDSVSFSKISQEKIYKLTYIGARLKEHLRILEVILSEGVKPGKVIIGLDDFALFVHPEKIRNKINLSFPSVNFYSQFNAFKKNLFRDPKIIELNSIINFKRYELEAVVGNLILLNDSSRKHKVKMLSLDGH